MNNLTDVRNFIRQCIAELGNGFHPDTPFEDYWTQIDEATESSTYTYAEAEERQLKMDAAMYWCDEHDIDIYDLAITALSSTESYIRMTELLK